MENKRVFGYSFDGENYNGEFLSAQEALEEAKKEAADIQKTWGDTETKIYIGVGKNDFVPTVDASRVIEDIQEAASDDGGEWAEDYLTDVTKEDYKDLETALTKAFNDWAEKHNYKPNWYIVYDRDVYLYKDGKARYLEGVK